MTKPLKGDFVCLCWKGHLSFLRKGTQQPVGHPQATAEGKPPPLLKLDENDRFAIKRERSMVEVHWISIWSDVVNVAEQDIVARYPVEGDMVWRLRKEEST